LFTVSEAADALHGHRLAQQLAIPRSAVIRIAVLEYLKKRPKV